MAELKKAKSVILMTLIAILVVGLHFKGCASGLAGMHVSSHGECDSGRSEQMIKIPHWKNAWMVVGDCDMFAAEKVSAALNVFYLEWIRTFGDSQKHIKKNLENAMIIFSRNVRRSNGFSVDGIYRKNMRVNGITHTKSLMWVRVRYPDIRLCETSLVHELVHASIWALKKTDGDPDHLGKKFSGWSPDHMALIDRTNKKLCSSN